ncbi:hypothetical protein TS85_11610 [Sphingomonas hengshuiensis]|uniref:Uncharacterized protein n=1 Tax=Sphingomonas hengshuiensis TaxID=1609977 RepID=A0A7U4J8Q2_9SPHN|nr:hypothetical protein [Sphingomonas hengshuiensis]AJP72296.1 hypothetical protein TS85_11610 [Sphingomonas hengshuiensis]
MFAEVDRLAERFGQALELLRVSGEGLGVERHHVRGLFGVGEAGAEIDFLGHQLLCPRVEPGGVAHALYQPIGDPVGLFADRGQAALQIGAVGDRIGGEALALRVIGAGIFGDQAGIAHFAFQAVQHRAFDRVEIIAARIGAVAAFAVARTADARAPALVAAHRRHARATGAAAEQAREGAARAAALPWFGGGTRGQPVSDLLP